MIRERFTPIALLSLLVASLPLMLLVHDNPFAPVRLQGWWRADLLSALGLLVLACQALLDWLESSRRLSQEPYRNTEGPHPPAPSPASVHGRTENLCIAAKERIATPRISMSSPLSHNVGEGAGGEGHPRHPNHLSATTRVNVLSALKPASGRGGKASQAFAFLLPTGLLSLALVTSHFVLLSGLLVGVGLLRSTRQQLGPLVVSLSAASGLILLGLQSGTWDYAAPLAGAGLNSLSFGLLLLALLLANGGVALVRGHPPQSDALFSLACCYLLLRLYSLGPWNLGWLLASLLLGAAVALAAAWQGAGAPSSATGAWQTAYLNGFILTGAGLGSEAGIVLAGYGLLLLPVVRLGFSAAPTPHWRYWLLCAALPLSAPFIMAWLAVAAALAGGLTLLAVSLWAAALLAALPVARLAHGQHQGQAQDEDSAAGRSAGQPHRGLHHYNILTGVGLSLATPFMLPGLLTPLAAQLQGGLTPFGSLELWPWAGLIAFNAARQPVATLPSIALIALMLILAALCWLGLRLRDRT